MLAKLPSAPQLARMLKAYPAGPERARGALQFLCGACGAEDGYLFVAGAGGEPQLAASQSDAPPPGLEEDMQRYWAKAAAQSDDSTDTLDIEQVRALQAAAPTATWVGPQGEAYQRLALHGRRDNRVALAAVAVLRIADAQTVVRFRHDLLGAIGITLGPECGG